MSTIFAFAAPVLLETGETWWQSYFVPVTSGVIVAVLLAVLRVVWNRRRVPSALSRRVRRKTYLGTVLSESERGDTKRLDVLAPRLSPVAENRMIVKIRAAWRLINDRDGVRVVILDSQESIVGGVELLNEGMDVRVTRRELGTESLSFHLFERGHGTASTAIVNHRVGQNDQPVRLDGNPATQVLRDHFDKLWEAGRPLEAVVAEKICDHVTGPGDPRAVWGALREIERRLNIDLRGGVKVLPHLAFRNSCQVVFIVGLPGAGKSHVRRKLAQLLTTYGIETRQLSDYSFLYRDFLRALVKLKPARGEGFKAHQGGAFEVSDIETLTPGLQALAEAVRVGVKEPRVILVEFARPDLVSALAEFDEVRFAGRVVYVRAPSQLRTERLNRRIEPHEVTVDDSSVAFKLTDNHLLPPAAKQSIYRLDNLSELLADSHWRGRVFQIDNDVDDSGAKIDAKLTEFVDSVIDLYRTPPPSHP